MRRRWAERVVAEANVGPSEVVVDLGAGTGALTRPLSRVARQVVAIELHEGRANALRAALDAQSGIRFAVGDVLSTALPGRPYRVLANPPWGIAAALVRRITEPKTLLVRADLVLPVPMVQRWVTSPPRGFAASRGTYLPAAAFDPPARQDAAVLVLRRLPQRGRRAPRTVAHRDASSRRLRSMVVGTRPR